MISLPWYAVFKDGSSINQFEGNKERLFKDVLERQDELHLFALRGNGGHNYIVDLEKGTIEIAYTAGERLEPRADMLRKKPYKYRLIYYREVTRTFGNNLAEVGTPGYIYFLGFQYTDENAKNHKRIMKIHEDRRIVIN